MEISYVATKEDYWRFHEYCVSRRLRISPLLQSLLHLLYAGIWCWMAFLMARHLWRDHFLLTFGYPGWKFFFLIHRRSVTNLVLYSLFLIYYFPLQKYLILRKAELQTALFAPVTRLLRQDALYSQQGTQKAFLTWHKFQSIVESRGDVYFMLEKTKGIIIPRHAFASRAAAAAFAEAARSYHQAAGPPPTAADGTPDYRPWPSSEAGAVWPPPPGAAAPKAARVRVVKTASGEAPDVVRQAWIGLILPVVSGPDGPVHQVKTKGVVSGEAQGIKAAYLIPTAAALSILAEVNPAAAQWWRENLAYAATDRPLVFPVESCELLTD